jgi:hypothetical protein
LAFFFLHLPRSSTLSPADRNYPISTSASIAGTSLRTYAVGLQLALFRLSLNAPIQLTLKVYQEKKLNIFDIAKKEIQGAMKNIPVSISN